MPRIDAPVMLVGSVPLSSSEEVLAVCAAEIGDLVAALPDGETGYRTNWINYQAYFVHHPHPQLETLQRPEPINGVEQWSPHGFEDLWCFRVKEGVDVVEYGQLFYAEAAVKSYVAFVDLRDRGRIPDGVRFQVSLPTPPGAIAAFFRAQSSDYERACRGYQRALEREVTEIVRAIPAADLAIQWDVCNEVMENEGAYPWLPQDGRGWDRYVETVRSVGSLVPPDALLGYHLCYGDLGGRHIVQPPDLSLLTRMANVAVAESGRPVDWLHMPVPLDRPDDEYFVALEQLKAPDAKLFLGLVHPADGVEGAGARLEAARRHAPTPVGIATECGFGRRPPDSVVPLLQLHRQVAEMALATRA
ncbi:MAG: hypothetical protein M3025_00010 [Actinomycetota bacterium]|nr:hypothetical protein [Actinomycetota bacterium]